jgi:hypothetical protein
VSAQGMYRSKGKDWQFCNECSTVEMPKAFMIIGKADYTSWVVSRGTSKIDPWKDDCEPLF